MYQRNKNGWVCNLTFVCFGAALLSLQCAPNAQDISASRTIDLQGHRGARGHLPENSLVGFAFALRHEMTTLELDTVLTADNRLVVHHDTKTNPKICRKVDGRDIVAQAVRELTVSELKQLDCGSKPNARFPEQEPAAGTQIPTLSEFFVFMAKDQVSHPGTARVRVNLELKFPDGVSDKEVEITVQEAIKEVETADMTDRVTIQSFYLPALTSIRRHRKDIALSALFSPSGFQSFLLFIGLDGDRDEIIDEALRHDAETISPHKDYVNADFVAAAHRKGLKVVPWTVNDSARMRELLEAGVDGIISDYPPRLFREVAAYRTRISP
jgi:glycerophosphoryl diester phosphodiesterase